MLLLRRPLPVFIFLGVLLPVRMDVLWQFLSLDNFTLMNHNVWRVLLLADCAMVLNSTGSFVVVALRSWFGDQRWGNWIDFAYVLFVALSLHPIPFNSLLIC
jgi:hypothetical protein